MINKWIGIGNTTKDVEVRYTQGGTAVCNFTVACNEKFKDKSGEWKERTEFVNVVAWAKLAEICGEYLAKGRQVYVEGRMQTRSWEKDGVTRYATEIVASEMKMLGNKNDNERARAGLRPKGEAYLPEDMGEPSGGFDDDIPF